MRGICLCGNTGIVYSFLDSNRKGASCLITCLVDGGTGNRCVSYRKHTTRRGIASQLYLVAVNCVVGRVFVLDLCSVVTRTLDGLVFRSLQIWRGSVSNDNLELARSLVACLVKGPTFYSMPADRKNTVRVRVAFNIHVTIDSVGG